MIVEFPTTLDVRFHHRPEGVRWELLSPFVTIVNPHTPEQRIIRTQPGFMTDFASVPRLPLVYLAYGNKAHLPAIPHDQLYREGGTEADRGFADNVFLHGMLGTVVPSGDNSLTEDDARAMYAAVRMFGGQHFNFTP
ncbi:MAG: DUF1353 domain-containing protein [Sulfuritalea sp.]|nr:DUF1353 domain-containing protein [Sulfuritalea sp.]